jgi:hypothetical protein
MPLGCNGCLIGQNIRYIVHFLSSHLDPNKVVYDLDWSRYKMYKYGYNDHIERYRVYVILFKIWSYIVYDMWLVMIEDMENIGLLMKDNFILWG